MISRIESVYLKSRQHYAFKLDQNGKKMRSHAACVRGPMSSEDVKGGMGEAGGYGDFHILKYSYVTNFTQK